MIVFLQLGILVMNVEGVVAQDSILAVVVMSTRSGWFVSHLHTIEVAIIGCKAREWVVGVALTTINNTPHLYSMERAQNVPT